MTRRILKRPQAELDLENFANYIANDSLAAAERFLSAAAAEFSKLSEMPEMASQWESENPRLKEIRVWPIRGFPNHVIFYRILQDGIEVVRVLHAAQDIQNALERLRD